MKTLSTTAIIALMTATLGASAIAPVMAQEAAPATQQAQPAEPAPPAPAGQPGPGAPKGPRHGGGFGGMLGFERGAEGVEIALVRLSHKIELTDEQQTLFDTLKTDAVAAAETFDTAVEGLRPTPPAEGQTPTVPDVSAQLENRIAMTKAQLAALEAVQPSLSAFFDSLTDEQKTALTPQPGEHGDRGGRFGGPRGNHEGGPRGDHEGGQRHGGPGGRSAGQPNNG